MARPILDTPPKRREDWRFIRKAEAATDGD